MPDLHSIEEEAARYVLEELSPAERRRFEACLEQSAELRRLVQQLEEGAIAVALASKQRQPPREVWECIEKSLHRNRSSARLSTIFKWPFWRTGWAIAAVCIIGWIGSTLYLLRPSPRPDTSPLAASEHKAVPSSPPEHGPATALPEQPQPPLVAINAAVQLLQARTQEIGALHRQISALSNRLSSLSRIQAQPRPSAPGQLTFFQLAPSSVTGAPPAPISTNLQRALFFAMARELGWLPPTTAAQGESADGQQHADAGGPGPVTTNQPPVDFLDLRSGANETLADSPPTDQPATPEPTELASNADATVPGFVSGTNAFLAFDSSIVPAGTSLSFYTTTSSGQQQSRGPGIVTFAGNRPLVVAVPFSGGPGDAAHLTIVANSAGGNSSVFQLVVPGNAAP